jgi:hypothetical protein
MKEGLISLMVAIVVAVLAVLVILGLSWFSLVTSRPMATYQKETERQVYQNSIARQQGANNGIAQDCANMQSNTGPEKLAFARFVLTDAAAYSGDRGLSNDALACVQQARTALSTAN